MYNATAEELLSRDERAFGDVLGGAAREVDHVDLAFTVRSNVDLVFTALQLIQRNEAIIGIVREDIAVDIFGSRQFSQIRVVEFYARLPCPFSIIQMSMTAIPVFGGGGVKRVGTKTVHTR